MKYRSEIDGLRAIAVVPVILFHAGFEIFSGGFVGVDVFFVISGYLITTIIINEMDEGKFSLLNFYERRARRILPALFFVVLCCLPFAWFLLLPHDLKDFSQSLVAVATFSSNILFWRESGYFDTAAELKPLLHTWSLAVEEQFYILFPLFLMAAWRFGKRAIVWTLVAAFVISLATAQWGAYNKPAATFYLLPTRAWELLIGSFAAFYLQKRSVTAPLWVSNALSAAGLIAVLYGVFAFDEATPFPSIYALAPTFGTVLIILFAVRGTAVHAMLSLKAFVGVGLISYSLYLWHQPVFAFWRHYSVFEPTHLQMVALSSVCVLLAYATFRFVEAPFRRSANALMRNWIFLPSLAVMLGFVVGGSVGHFKDGWATRIGAGGVPFSELEKYLAGNPGIDRECIEQRDIDIVLNNPNCSSSDDPGVLLWGDSYAMYLYGMLSADPAAQTLGVVQIALSQCMPNYLLGLNGSVTSADECNRFNSQVMEHLNGTKYRYVIMSSPFNRVGKVHYDMDGREHIISSPGDLLNLLAETARQVESTGAEAIFVTPPPTNGSHLGLCATGMLWRGGNPSRCNYQTQQISFDRIQVFEIMHELSKEFKVVNLEDYLCRSALCVAEIDGVPVYRDTGHFSNDASVLIGRSLAPFNGVLSSNNAP